VNRLVLGEEPDPDFGWIGVRLRQGNDEYRHEVLRLRCHLHEAIDALAVARDSALEHMGSTKEEAALLTLAFGEHGRSELWLLAGSEHDALFAAATELYVEEWPERDMWFWCRFFDRYLVREAAYLVKGWSHPGANLSIVDLMAGHVRESLARIDPSLSSVRVESRALKAAYDENGPRAREIPSAPPHHHLAFNIERHRDPYRSTVSVFV
jgi:hypothetical protein